MDTSAVLASAEDRVIDETVAALAQDDQARQSPIPDGRRREVRQLFRLVLRCVRAGRAKPIIRPSEQIAAHCYAAGIDLAEVQRSFTVLAEVLWRQLADALAGEQMVQALGLLTAITGAGKDSIARTYVALATRDRNDEQPADGPAAAGAGSEDLPRGAVQTLRQLAQRGRTGITRPDPDCAAAGVRVPDAGVAAPEHPRGPLAAGAPEVLRPRCRLRISIRRSMLRA